MLAQRRFPVLFKVGCFAGAGFLAGAVLGIALSALLFPPAALILGSLCAALGGSYGTLAATKRVDARAPRSTRRYQKLNIRSAV